MNTKILDRNNKYLVLVHLETKTIALIGFMGCGKSAVGRELARRIYLPFIDLDREIQEVAGKSIADIFKIHGEAGFRELERKTLLQFLDNPEPLIIGTGGGTPCYFDNLHILLEKSTVVYIDTPVEVLHERLLRGMVKRPLISHLTPAELMVFIRDKLKARESIYKQAHLKISGALPMHKKVEILINKLREY